MFTPGFDPILYHKVRYQELWREAQDFRLVQEVLRARPQEVNLVSRLIVEFGKWLVMLGTGMEKRYSVSSQPESHLRYNSSLYKGS